MYGPINLRFLLCVYMEHVYFVWLSEQIADFALKSINNLVFITEVECLLPGTGWVLV